MGWAIVWYSQAVSRRLAVQGSEWVGGPSLSMLTGADISQEFEDACA